MNTAAMTKVIAMTAPAICSTAFRVAASGSLPSASMMACTASITTMALSTTIPMASTSANSVIRFSVIPNSCMKAKVPTSDTGTAIAGISVERQSPRKMKTTRPTSTNASTSVCSTFSIDASRNVDTS